MRVLSDDDIEKIAGTYHAWRNHDGGYRDEAGFAKAASLDERKKNGYVLTPGRYVGTAQDEQDDEPIEEKIERLKSDLFAEFERGRVIEDDVRRQLEQF